MIVEVADEMLSLRTFELRVRCWRSVQLPQGLLLREAGTLGSFMAEGRPARGRAHTSWKSIQKRDGLASFPCSNGAQP